MRSRVRGQASRIGRKTSRFPDLPKRPTFPYTVNDPSTSYPARSALPWSRRDQGQDAGPVQHLNSTTFDPKRGRFPHHLPTQVPCATDITAATTIPIRTPATIDAVQSTRALRVNFIHIHDSDSIRLARPVAPSTLKSGSFRRLGLGSFRHPWGLVSGEYWVTLKVFDQVEGDWVCSAWGYLVPSSLRGGGLG